MLFNRRLSSLRARVLALTAVLAALICLGGYAWFAGSRLARWRLASDTAAARAFERAVSASDSLSTSLRSLAYATDDALARSLCARAASEAGSASAALSVLPFATQEMESLLGFLGRAQDYAAGLTALSDAPDEQTREHLRQLSSAAADVAQSLRALQGQLHEGSVAMDRREARLMNVGRDARERLSARLLAYEADFDAPEEFAYDGAYSPAEPEEPGQLSEAEARALAARAADVAERELREEYSAEGPEGRRCYSAGGLLIGVSSRGLEYLAQTRLVGEPTVDAESARQAAVRFLQRCGFDGLESDGETDAGSILHLRYAPVQDGALRVDEGVSVSIALDDGSVYAFDGTRYRERTAQLSWNVDAEAARRALPEGVSVQRERRVIVNSPGGTPRPCWEFVCTGRDSESVRILVSAETGRQCAITLQ